MYHWPCFFSSVKDYICNVKVPPFLKPGDCIALTATARSITQGQIESSVEFMKSHGFEILIDPLLFRIDNQFGGTDRERAEFFNSMLANSSVRAMWNVRGGYGTGRMVDGVDFSLLEQDPKWLLGFSDYTVLHCHVQKQLQMATLHATMPIFMFEKEGKDLEDVTIAMESLAMALKGNFTPVECGDKHMRERAFEGKIIGGNLSVLLSVMGTPSEPELDDWILFIEDLDEYYYHVDRMMQTLKRSGKLSKLKAMLVGSFIQMHDHTIPFGKDVRQIIEEYCSDYDFPVIFDVNAGHHLQNKTIPFGVTAKYQKGIITFANS